LIKVRLARVDLIQLESSWILSSDHPRRAKPSFFKSKRR
jgi:hypothetical protein